MAKKTKAKADKKTVKKADGAGKPAGKKSGPRAGKRGLMTRYGNIPATAVDLKRIGCLPAGATVRVSMA